MLYSFSEKPVGFAVGVDSLLKSDLLRSSNKTKCRSRGWRQQHSSWEEPDFFSGVGVGAGVEQIQCWAALDQGLGWVGLDQVWEFGSGSGVVRSYEPNWNTNDFVKSSAVQ